MNAPVTAPNAAARAAATPALGRPPSAPGRGAALPPARHAVQRPHDAQLLVVQADGCVRGLPRRQWEDLLRPGDLVVANDAATLPASLAGHHVRSGGAVELRLAARDSLDPQAVRDFTAVLFGAGDWRTLTEHRAPPPPVQAGDVLALGPLQARVLALLDHPRLLRVRFDGEADGIWAALARHGRPVQYAHLARPLALWDVWTRVAAQPVAFEPPSAGFVLDWSLLAALRQRGVAFATLTHAAGLSSTGDALLDARLPLAEPYHVPAATVAAIAAVRGQGGRVVAIGTTVARALEDCAAGQGGARRAGGLQAAGLRPGDGLATLRLGPQTPLRVVDVLLSGTHEPGSSHHELLRAFTTDAVLERAARALRAWGYRTHEFGDSVWLERSPARGHAAGARPAAAPTAGP
jgi:S-adenosylmethionine:tRNA ribosyltransferase-isomerase